MKKTISSSARLRWACRRGMLELDLLLLPFFERIFATLSEHDQQLFEQLLSCNDQELYNWLIKHESVTYPELTSLVERVRHGC